MNIIPIIPVAIDTWMMRVVAASATIIRTMAPKRSDQGARLRNTHHTTIASAPTSSPITPNPMAPGTTIGTTNLASHCSTTATTPGHSRSFFCELGSSVCAIVIIRTDSPQEPFVPQFLGRTLLSSLRTPAAHAAQNLQTERVRCGAWLPAPFPFD